MGEMREYASVRVSSVADTSGQVAHVELIGPGYGNAMGPDFWREAAAGLRGAGRRPRVRAVVVSGSDKMFSSGLDLPAVMGGLAPKMMSDGGLAGARTDLLDEILEMQKAMNAVESCRKPVIAAIHHWCIGGGVDLIAACDIRIASADAKFSIREVKVAIVADMGSLQRLPRIIGEGNTKLLALTGRDIDSAEALRLGLISAVYDDKDALLKAAFELAQEIAANPPLVVQGTKRVMNDTRDLPTAEALRHVAVWNSAFLNSHDLMEAVTAFAERREPEFRGR